MESRQERAPRDNFANWGNCRDDENEINDRRLLFPYYREVRSEP